MAQAILDSGLAHCRVVVEREGPLLLTLALAGLTGGIGHCTGMCGPFVLSQVGARLERVPAAGMREWHRLTGALLVPYHLGRVTTYALLGAVSGLLVSRVGGFASLKLVSAGLLLLAAALFVAQAWPRLVALLRAWHQQRQDDAGPQRLRRGCAKAGGCRPARAAAQEAPQVTAAAGTDPGAATTGGGPNPGGGRGRMDPRRWIRSLVAAPTGGRGYVLGLMLGFLPCGLVYGALAAAAATGDAVAAAMGMAAFGLGTVPALVGVGLLGHLAGMRWRSLVVERVAPLLLVANALVLTGLALRLLA